MANDFARSIKVYLNSAEYSKSMTQMKGKLEEYRNELQKLIQAGEGGSEKAERYRKNIERLDKTVRTHQQRLKETERVLNNLSGASFNEINTAVRQMRSHLRELNTDTVEYKDSLLSLQKGEERLNQINRELNAQNQTQATLWQRLSSSLNKYFLTITTSISGLFMLISGGRKAVEAYMEVDEALARIRKYAGLTDEEVRALSKDLGSLEKINTRTAHLQLLDLAADAGRLGIKGKDNLEKFVSAADKIKLALGEDLGEDAVTNIGKITNLLGEDKRLGLETAMLSTASAVTKLAKSSTAAEPPMVEFTARMGGIGSVANISIPQILGLSSALDQNMQSMETSATVFSTLITKLFQDPAHYAKLAGKDVEEFTQLLKTNANEALLQFLSAMRERGGFDQIAPMFEEMHLQGRRSVQVLSTVASHVDQVREAQLIATEAYRDNIEVEHEFQIVNNTAQAQLDKRKKQLQQIRVEVGEKLLPVMVHVRTTQNILLRTLSLLIDAFGKHWIALTGLATAVLLYTTNVKASIVVDKLKVLWNEKLIGSFKKLFTLIKSNPWGAIIAGLAVVIDMIANLVRTSKTAVESLESVEKAQKRAADATETEARRMNTLLGIIGDTNTEEAARREAMNQLISLNPDFLGALDAQKSSYEDAKYAVADYIQYLQMQAEMEELIQSKSSLQEQLDQVRAKPEGFRNKVSHFLRNIAFQSAASPTYATPYGTSVQMPSIGKSKDELWEDYYSGLEAPIKANLQAVDDRMEELQKKMETMLINARKRVNQYSKTVESGLMSSDQLKESYEGSGGLIEQLKDEYDRIQHDLEMALARRQISEHEYGVRSGKNEAERQAALITLYQRYYDSLDNVTFEKEENRQKMRDAVNKNRIKAEENLESALVNMEKSYYDSMDAVRKLNSKAETDQTEQLMNEYEKRRATALECYNAIAAYIMLNVSDSQTAYNLLYQAQQSYYNTLAQLSQWFNYKVAEADLKTQREHLNMLKKYGADTSAQEHEIALQELDMYYQARLLTDEEYYQARRNLEDNYTLTSAQNHEKVLSQYITQSLTSKYQLDLLQLEAYHKKGMLSEEEYQKSLLALKYKYAREYASQYMSMASNMVQAMQDAEIAAVESKYEVLIRAAENNGEDTAQLEQDAANEKLKIQKKYAMSNLVVKLSQITADTAVAIMTGFAQLGPIAGAVAAVMLAMTGAAQYAAAFAEYNKISRISLQSTPSSTSPEAGNVQRVVQFASGKYDVIGADDGRTYHVPYLGPASTGVVTRPALVGERGTELIIAADTLDRLRSHINYPMIVNAINDARSGRVPQHASGSYDALADPTSPASYVTGSAGDDKAGLLKWVIAIYNLLKSMPNNKRCYVVLDDINEAQELKDRSSAPFTRGDNKNK